MEFDEEIMSQWYAEKREQFGNDWPNVRMLMHAFERIGVYLSDVHPRNIACREMPGVHKAIPLNPKQDRPS